MLSIGEGLDASEAFRSSGAFGRRDSMNSTASLNLHRARPVRQDSIASNAEGLEAAEAVKHEFAVDPNTVIKSSWRRQDLAWEVSLL